MSNGIVYHKLIWCRHVTSLVNFIVCAASSLVGDNINALAPACGMWTTSPHILQYTHARTHIPQRSETLASPTWELRMQLFCLNQFVPWQQHPCHQ